MGMACGPGKHPNPFCGAVTVCDGKGGNDFSLNVGKGMAPGRTRPVLVCPCDVNSLGLRAGGVLCDAVHPRRALKRGVGLVGRKGASLGVRLKGAPRCLGIMTGPAGLTPNRANRVSVLVGTGRTGQGNHVATRVPMAIRDVNRGGKARNGLRITTGVVSSFDGLATSRGTGTPMTRLSNALLSFNGLPSGDDFVPLINNQIDNAVRVAGSKGSPLIVCDIAYRSRHMTISNNGERVGPNAATAFGIAMHPGRVGAGLRTLVGFMYGSPGNPMQLIGIATGGWPNRD